jgi:hypothetical protein
MGDHSILVIIVVNQPDSATEIVRENSALFHHIKSKTSLQWQQEDMQLRSLNGSASAVLLVDRFTRRPLPKKYGVGLARKIGADIALNLIARGVVDSSWIHTSDADTILPDTYFSILDNSVTAATVVLPYRHLCADDDIGRATRLYELQMRDYVLGLTNAGSRYAYHSLGSTLIINSTDYARVRGFPKRNGGEDFYLLNKIAKVGNIVSLSAPEIHILARNSDRAPFGTGPAVARLLSSGPLDQIECFYNPEVFVSLRLWLNAIPDTWQQPLSGIPIATVTRQVLQCMAVDGAINSARRNSRTLATYTRHIHAWFDAFKTLRFIHLLRDHGLSNVTLANSGIAVSKIPGIATIGERNLLAKPGAVNADSRDSH